MKLKIIILFALLVSNITAAQSKVGTVNSDYILNLMPEGKTVVKLTKAYAERLDSVFSIKVATYQKSLAEFKNIDDSLIQETKTKKLIEVQKLENDVNQAKQTGTQLMRQKENELMRPLYKKLGDAIAAVAKENGYTQILTVQGNEFAYLDRNFDITELVMAKLNIKKPTPTDKK
jgi:outer membrane protein